MGRLSEWSRLAVSSETFHYANVLGQRKEQPGDGSERRALTTRLFSGTSEPSVRVTARCHSRRPSKLPYFAEAIRYVVFDLLSLGGRSLLDRPLVERRELLRETLSESRVVFPCEGVIGKSRSFFKKVVAAGHEGVVAKRLSSRYVPNQRSRGWLKFPQSLALSSERLSSDSSLCHDFRLTADRPSVLLGFWSRRSPRIAGGFHVFQVFRSMGR